MTSYDRYITTDTTGERSAEMEQAVDEYLEKVGYHSEMCPHCLSGVYYFDLIDLLYVCSKCDETSDLSTTQYMKRNIARATAEEHIKEMMEERE